MVFFPVTGSVSVIYREELFTRSLFSYRCFGRCFQTRLGVLTASICPIKKIRMGASNCWRKILKCRHKNEKRKQKISSRENSIRISYLLTPALKKRKKLACAKRFRTYFFVLVSVCLFFFLLFFF